MKKIILMLVVIFLLLSAFVVLSGQRNNIKADNQTQAQQDIAGKDIAAEVDKAGDVAEKEISKFAEQLDRLVDVIEKHIRNIMPKIQEIRQTVEEKMKQFQAQPKTEEEIQK